jgi:hypothetical protein
MQCLLDILILILHIPFHFYIMKTLETHGITLHIDFFYILIHFSIFYGLGYAMNKRYRIIPVINNYSLK